MNFVGHLIELGLNNESPIIGLTEEEINEIQIAQKVVLPTEFVKFLQQCGRSAGSYGRDVETFYNAYKVLKEWFFEAVEEFSTKMQIPPTAFFFLLTRALNMIIFCAMRGQIQPFIGHIQNCRDWKK